MSQSDDYVVIMAGGIGSRFWPFSRTNTPKQFHDVLGVGRTLLQLTLDRLKRIVPEQNIYIVTNKQYYELVKQQAPYLTDHQILLEPIGRNTSPCAAYANYKIAKQNPNANIVVAPSDHVILREDDFIGKIRLALDTARNNPFLVTLGISPTRPDTGYGYIQFQHDENSEIKKVKTFTEKPQHDLAVKFIESGDFVWNSGIFIWNVKTFGDSLARFLPDMNELFRDGIDTFYTPDEQAFIDRTYPQCNPISLDYGIMEKADNVFTILADIGWSDLGTWKSLYEMKDKDFMGNVIEANIMIYDSHNCIVKGQPDHLLVVQGLQNYIVAQYENVTMICHRDQEQMVRNFVQDAKNHKGSQFV